MRRLSRLSLPLQLALTLLLLLLLLLLGGADDLGRGEEGEGGGASYPCFYWFLLQGLPECQDAAFLLSIIHHFSCVISTLNNRYISLLTSLALAA